jgi:hypothetical protein
VVEIVATTFDKIYYEVTGFFKLARNLQPSVWTLSGEETNPRESFEHK